MPPPAKSDNIHICIQVGEIQRIAEELKNTSNNISDFKIEMSGSMATLTERVTNLTVSIDDLKQVSRINDESNQRVLNSLTKLEQRFVKKEDCIDTHLKQSKELAPVITKVDRHDTFFMIIGGALLALWTGLPQWLLDLARKL